MISKKLYPFLPFHFFIFFCTLPHNQTPSYTVLGWFMLQTWTPIIKQANSELITISCFGCSCPNTLRTTSWTWSTNSEGIHALVWLHTCLWTVMTKLYSLNLAFWFILLVNSTHILCHHYYHFYINYSAYSPTKNGIIA